MHCDRVHPLGAAFRGCVIPVTGILMAGPYYT